MKIKIKRKTFFLFYLFYEKWLFKCNEDETRLCSCGAQYIEIKYLWCWSRIKYFGNQQNGTIWNQNKTKFSSLQNDLILTLEYQLRC